MRGGVSNGPTGSVPAQYDSTSGEVVGVFESLQPSDTDMGSKVPKEVKIEGIWYGQLA